uniref:Uncharacterized protein n=1 Tax=Anguilla anguilla TaxID=7936 RepID=A0A0E9PZU9_ANGAN
MCLLFGLFLSPLLFLVLLFLI